MKKQKVAIIGAGISGLYLAWKLSEKGHLVTVFEKKEKIGNLVCSGLFSERILEFIPKSRELIQNKINFVRLHFPKRTLRIDFSKEFFVMSHFELDNLVADFAQKAGAEIILNQNISWLAKGFDRIIGCEGANSFIRRSLGLPDPIFRLAIHGFIKKKSNEKYVEAWPSQSGFIWRIPRNNEIEYGILEKPNRSKKIFDDFLKKNNISIERVKSKIVAQGLIIPRNPLITLCGEAAGLTKPWSGGGVIWGLTAAEILLKNFPDFLAYQKEIKKFFIPKIILSKTAIKLVYFFGFKMPWLLPKKTKIESDFLR